MSEHKAPTVVTLAPHQEPSAFSQWMHKHWKAVALVLVVAAALAIGFEVRKGSREQDLQESWASLLSLANRNDATGRLEGSPGDLIALTPKLAPAAAPWALYLGATSALEERDYDNARRAIEQLQGEAANHSINEIAYPFVEGGQPVSLSERVRSAMEAQHSWAKEHASLFANSALPDGSPRIKLNTDAGAITVGLYQDLAPKHAANFLELCRKGFFDGTKFHRVLKGVMVQGGDPNTKEDSPSTWGQGGPGYTLEREDNALRHFRGVLAAAKRGNEKESSGSQFFITTSDAHQYDSKYVIFGAVMDGMAVVSALEAAPVVENTDRPVTPVAIVSTEILTDAH